MNARYSLPSASQRGFALVLTLVILVIASALLLGFIAATKQNRIATNSYARGMQAQELALGALDQITGDLRSEIINNSDAKDPIPASTASSDSAPVKFYVPKTPKDRVPLRLGFDTSSANMVNLIRRSAVPAADSAAANSTDNSSLASADGRKISPERWNKPQLLLNAAAAGSPPADFVAPDWIVVTRNGPKSDATDGDLANFKNSDPKNPDFAVGRFAYTVYDEGGLLNVNVAGYPAAAKTAESGRQVGGKETAAWADLTQIGLTQPQIDLLGGWRNPVTWVGNYAKETALGLSMPDPAATPDPTKDSKGFTRVRTDGSTSDNALLSRQELIDYAKANNWPTTVLPNLTTFSFALNAASYLPPATDPSKVTATAAAKALDKARTQIGLYYLNGKPLRRFPLNARLKLLDSYSPSDLKKYFGLSQGSGWAAPGYRFWKLDQNLVAGGIGTIQDAITAGREPNFFEILKTAILEGSLGTEAGAGARNSFKWEGDAISANRMATIDNQVVRIGANIIDQYDSDNYPTTIRYGSGANTFDFYGIEDLPYFSEVFIQSYCKEVTGAKDGATIGPAAQNPQVTMVNTIYFELWNPHQASPAIPGVTVATPSTLQIRIPQGTFQGQLIITDWGQPPKIPITTSNFPPTAVIDLAKTTTPIQLNPTSYGQYRLPHLVQDGSTNSQTFGSQVVNGFQVSNSWQNNSTIGGQLFATYDFKKVAFTLEYLDGTTSTYHPYTTLSGVFNPTGTDAFLGGVSSANSSWNNMTGKGGLYPSYAFDKPDPRTDRLGVNVANNPNARLQINQPMICAAAPYSSGGFSVNEKQSNYVPRKPDGNPRDGYPGTLVTNIESTLNDKTDGAKDHDRVFRPGDAWSTALEPQTDPMTVPSARPVILNRPFRSVGELGYVFRDQPWKTLNFFTGDDPAKQMSADAALLDVFCLEDTDPRTAPVLAGTTDPRNNLISGQVNLNTQNKEVLAALLSGTISKYTLGGSLDANAATTIAQALKDYTGGPPDKSTPPMPISSPSELVTGFMKSIETKTSAPFSPVKQEREAIIRALASTGQTRTWNLLIDVIAQSGRFPNSATTTDLSKFLVEGERRYWLHVAIDRLTGEVIAKELEPVVE